MLPGFTYAAVLPRMVMEARCVALLGEDGVSWET